jgi:primary-amine oxidase
VIQTSGQPSAGLPAWIAENPNESVENTDVVLWHSFGLTHFATPEDYPIMPAEPITLMLRPRHFFERNPCMDGKILDHFRALYTFTDNMTPVPPSYNITPTQVRDGKKGCACAASKESVRV